VKGAERISDQSMLLRMRPSRADREPQLLHLCRCRAQVAAVRVRDAVPTGAPAPDAQSEQPHGDPFSAVDGECPPEAAVVVKCIMLRAAFGGMAGDVEMLTGFAPAWQRRCAPCVPS